MLLFKKSDNTNIEKHSIILIGTQTVKVSHHFSVPLLKKPCATRI